MNKSLLPTKFSKALVCSVAFGGALLGAPSASWASAGYFAYLIQEYSAVGDCRFCHLVNPGTAGTALQPFAETLKAEGLTGGENSEALIQALMNLGDTDSDGDGASDVEELRGQGNANDPAVLPGGFVAPEEVEYGCVGGTIAGTRDSSSFSGALAAGLVAGALLLSRRRRA